MNQSEYNTLSQEAIKLKPSLFMATAEIILQIIFLTLGFWLSSLPLTFWILGQVLLGITFWRSFAILHACGHHAFSTHKRMDDIIGISQSIFCFIPYYSWKFIHFDHHRWTGWLDLDPTMRNLEKGTSPLNLKILNLCWKLWIPIISIHYIITVFFKRSEALGKRPAVAASILFVLLVHAFLMWELDWSYLRYFGVSAFVYLNMGDISLLTQHVHLPMDHSKGSEVAPKRLWEQDEYSHTVEMPGWISRWIVLGFNYHSLHHLFPTMPYYHSNKIIFRGKHTQEGKAWLLKAKSMKASELIYLGRD
jgi:fatty acid desaturase